MTTKEIATTEPMSTTIRPVELFRTEAPGVWLARSRSHPARYHLLTNVGSGFEMCDCQGYAYRLACAHIDAVNARTDVEVPGEAD